jgi:hypothetical protein
MLVFAGLNFATAQPQVNVRASADFSFDELNQYGEWVSVSGYGEVWRPYASNDWRPFVYGRWVWSNDGWMWESDEPFGWIVCHYGNWFYDDDWGWVWLPGYEWSPARVDWHVSDAEVGWMPMMPPGHRSHARVEWTFCPYDAFAGVEIHSHVSYRPRTSVTVVHQGPPRIEYVRSHSRVNVVTVQPRKVYVESRQRRFVRVEPAYTHRQTVVVPVGPQFRVESRSRHDAVRVESNSQPHRSSVRVESHVSVPVPPPPPVPLLVPPMPGVNVTVTNESQHRHQYVQPAPVRVESHQSSSHGGTRVRVESSSSGGSHESSARAKVTVRKKD